MALARRIDCDEGVPLTLEPREREALRGAMQRLRFELGLRLAPLLEDDRGTRIYNIVGAIDLLPGTTLHIRPKTGPGDDWIKAVLALLVGSDSVDAAGERAAGISAARPDLFEALAARFAARLERALHRDGPILTMQRERRDSSTLSGKLDATAWSRRFLTHPTHFPIEMNRLSADNDFARALAFVADRLAKGTRNLVTRARLRRTVGLLRPGLPVPHVPPVGAERRHLPPQWAVYGPAWSIACAVLARRSLLGPEGSMAGISIAIEAWPLLERLLHRSLESAATQGRSGGRAMTASRQKSIPLLSPTSGGLARVHFAEPDGMLFENGVPIATFEAKYRDIDAKRGPEPHEVYQALAAARAAGSGLAVLVYPGSFAPMAWSIDRPGAYPSRLVALGLEMFSYRPGGEKERGDLLLNCVG